MKIYNSLTKRKEEFETLEPNKVKMYACGITVSGPAHIGHAVQAIIFDIVRKYLEKKNYAVNYVRNYTDVDDKIIAASLKLKINALEFAKQNIEKTDAEIRALGVSDATIMLASQSIKEIIDFNKKLINKGYAYVTKEGNVYFAIEKYSDYGKLSGRKLKDMKEGVRKETEPDKKHPLDFALWKAAKPGEISWDSPWGKGRPGWHIECSAMNLKAFGEQIDIHGGGRDLLFPHHENELAQTEGLTGKRFAKFWMHNGLVKVNGVKMSKSLGNSILISDVLEKYHPEVIRFALLSTNYKNDINITDDLFPIAKKHMDGFYKAMHEYTGKAGITAEEIEEQFNKAMDDDFNTALALSNLHGIFKRNPNPKDIKKTYGLLGLFKESNWQF